MSRFTTTPVRIYSERAEATNPAVFNFGPASVPTAFAIELISLTWSAATGTARDVFQLYSVLGGFTQLMGEYHLTQNAFSNLQNPVTFARLLPGCRGRFLSTLGGGSAVAIDYQVTYKLVRARV